MQLYKKLTSSKKAIIFFGGFGAHPSHFLPFLPKDCNIFLLHNYTHLDFKELKESLETKELEITLIAFSMGVFVARIFLEQCTLKCKKIAINGTEFGIHNSFGIPLRAFKLTLKYFNLDIFKQNLFAEHLREAKDFIFLDEKTLQNELEFFIKNHKEHKNFLQWDLAIISKRDLIVNPNAQKAFWEQTDTKEILEINAPHFLFFDYKLC